MTSDIANGVCEQFTVDGIVCPPKMRKELFTVAEVDNIDRNPSSATARVFFHGTSISLMQFPTKDYTGHERGVVIINSRSSSSKSVAPLPASYSNVPPTTMKVKQFTVPATAVSVTPRTFETVHQAIKVEKEWYYHAEVLQKKQLDKKEWISWRHTMQVDKLQPVTHQQSPGFCHSYKIARIR